MEPCPSKHSLQSSPGNSYENGRSSNKVDARTITSQKPVSILIVDDDTHCRNILRTILEGEGYSCTEAENGLAAIKTINEKGADFIITDFHMPDMNGCEFLEKLSNGQTRLTPAIMITGNLEYAIRRRAMIAGALCVLSKPFERIIMLDMIRKAVNGGDPMVTEKISPT